MPINDPVNNRKVAPASLAFERRRASYGAVYVDDNGIDEPDITYQYFITNNIDIRVNNYVTNNIYKQDISRITKAIADSEHRSKHFVGDYKQSFQWDINANWLFNTQVWTPVPFNNEILRTQGIRNESMQYSPTWSFRPTEENAGVWWIYSYVQIKFGGVTNIDEARLSIFVNGVRFRDIDMVDHHDTGHADKIRDCHLQGGAHVPLRAGDKMEIMMYTFDNAPRMGGVIWPSSIYGYVTAHRENCELNITDNTPDTGVGYAFTKGSP